MAHKYALIFFLITFLTSCVASAPVASTSVAAFTATAFPETPTALSTITSTPNPELQIFALAYALRDQYGDFDVIRTDEGKQQVVFQNGKYFEMVDGDLKEVLPPPAVKDLNPIYTEDISQDYMGVQIITRLITDETLSVSDPPITKISINPNFNNYYGQKSEVAIAHFIARVVFKVSWSNGEIEHKGGPTEDDFKAFMEAWSEAQKGSDPELWKKVQFSIFANDLATPRYIQQRIVVWPMYVGNQAFDDIKVINDINIVFVNGLKVENITLYTDTGPLYGIGVGVNIEKKSLFIYQGVGYGLNVAANTAKPIGGRLSTIPAFLISNTGGPVKASRSDKALQKIIMTEIGTNAYKAAFKVYPPSEEEKKYNP
jgi:hypothetical protein